MVLGAILVVGAPGAGGNGRSALRPSGTLPVDSLPEPLACIEILGRSIVERMVERFLAADAEMVSVVVDSRIFQSLPHFRQSHPKVSVVGAEDVWSAAADAVKSYAESGVDYALITTAGTYTECDFIDLLWFHRGTHQPITRAFNRNREDALDLWIVDCAKVQPADVLSAITTDGTSGSASYLVSEYVVRVENARTVRRLAVDAFNSRCGLRPSGQEIRPGVWIDEGADIDKRARLVAPAYIGRGSKICEDTVITRCSSVESHCHIDYGTVIEDSSILTDSYVGIWLDVSHAVVRGNRLFNLGHDVTLNISDVSVLRQNSVLTEEKIRNDICQIQAQG